MTAAPLTHAAWCEMGASELECTAHPDPRDKPLRYQTAKAATYGKGPACVDTAVWRVLEPDFRYGAVPVTDTCIITVGFGLNGRDPNYVEMLVDEARELAASLTRLCDMADADACSSRAVVT